MVGGHVSFTGIEHIHVDMLSGHLKEEDQLEDLDVSGRITLK